MPILQVSLNGKKLCMAGIRDRGVLSAIITWVRRKGAGASANAPENGMMLHVGGLITPKGEHVTWTDSSLKPGDVVRVKIVEAGKIDRPRERRRRDLALDMRQQKQHTRKMAEKFGWKIVVPARKRRTSARAAKTISSASGR